MNSTPGIVFGTGTIDGREEFAGEFIVKLGTKHFQNTSAVSLEVYNIVFHRHL